MHTPDTGEIRPNTALPVHQAAHLASECKRLARELEETALFAGDLKADHPAIRELVKITDKLIVAGVLLGDAHLTAQGLWDAACVAEDANQGGQGHD